MNEDERRLKIEREDGVQWPRAASGVDVQPLREMSSNSDMKAGVDFSRC